MYEVSDAKSVLGVGLHISNRKVEPLIVAVGVCVILHEKGISIQLFF